MDEIQASSSAQVDSKQPLKKDSMSKAEKTEALTRFLIRKIRKDRNKLIENFVAAYAKKGRNVSLTHADISNYIKEDSTGRVIDDEAGLRYIADFNGINCLALRELKKAQITHKIFPIPYFYEVTPNVLMIEANYDYVGYAKDMLSKVLTQRYLYDALVVSNKIMLFLLTIEESRKSLSKHEKYSDKEPKIIPLKKYDTKRPLLKEVATDEILSLENIKKLLLQIMDCQVVLGIDSEKIST